MAPEPMSTLEVSQIIISIVTVGGSVLASFFTTYAWVRAKFAANDVEITNIKLALKEHQECGIREGAILANELMSMRRESSHENEEIKKIVTQVQINIASHDGILKNLDRLIEHITKN